MTNLLQVHNLSKHFDGIEAVQDVSFDLCQGEIVALIGGNGAGKSTLLNLIAGLEKPDTGRIVFNEQDVTRRSFRARAQAGIALCFQRPRLFRNESCMDNLIVSRHGHPGETLAGSLFGSRGGRAFEAETRQKAIEVLEFVGMADKATGRAGALSGGQQKLLYLAMLLINDPQILLLDEPFANVSSGMIAHIGERLRTVAASGKALFVVEHHIAEVSALSDRFLRMDRGKLVEAPANKHLAAL